MKALVSMSVYGERQMYWDGAVKNASLVCKIYPGWTLRVYCTQHPMVLRLRDLGCDVHIKSKTYLHSGMMWRFFPAWEKEYDCVIFRDADSRLNEKEATAVKAWLDSGKNAHAMHDHAHHACYPLFGGMWGVRSGVLSDQSFELCKRVAKRPLQRVGDMQFLLAHVYPQIATSILHHSSVKLKWPYEPFPKHGPLHGFVGQQYGDDGSPIVV